MALINCPECGRMISDKAERCPHYGVRPEKRKGGSVVGLILVILASVALVLGQYLLYESKMWGYYVSDGSYFVPAMILFGVMAICGILSSVIFLGKNKLAGNLILGFTALTIIAVFIQLAVYSRIESWETVNTIHNEEVTKEVIAEASDPEIARAGWNYIRENMAYTDLSLTRYDMEQLALKRFQYLDESTCSKKDSPLKSLKGASWGFYDIAGPSFGMEMIWVFFKNGQPRFMCTKDQYSDRDLLLHLIGAWDDRSPEQKAWDDAVRQLDLSRSYRR